MGDKSRPPKDFRPTGQPTRKGLGAGRGRAKGEREVPSVVHRSETGAWARQNWHSGVGSWELGVRSAFLSRLVRAGRAPNFAG